MPWCLEEIDRIYRRLGRAVRPHPRRELLQPDAADVVEDLRPKGIAEESEGAHRHLLRRGASRPP